MAEETFTITRTTKNPAPAGLPFARVKEVILGRRYRVSLVFIGDARSRTLNRKYRRKDAPTDILSFPLGKENGEIFINLNRARSESRHLGRSPRAFILFLFIHGLLHLKGFRHGGRMEVQERQFCRRFRI